jgi:DNA mismatch repair protein MutH
MEKPPYDRSDPASILRYAERLEGHTLREVVGDSLPKQPAGGNKGNFGLYIETHYFGYANNSDSEPDFREAGVELKTSSLRLDKNGLLCAKERIKLSAINYEKLQNEAWESCSLMRKNRLLLLVFTFHEADKSPFDRTIERVLLWDFPSEDLEVIRRDWEKIRGTVVAGRLDELSEGATDYLGACTSGPGERKKQRRVGQPKPRAFSLRQPYVNAIVSGQHLLPRVVTDLDEFSGRTLREVIESRFAPYVGWSARELALHFDVGTSHSAKNYYAILTKAVLAHGLGVVPYGVADELVKAGYQVKTIRLRANGTPREDVSFPAFKFTTLVQETWEDSVLRGLLESPFLFVIFKIDDDGVYRFRGVRIWSMPAKDIDVDARRLWEATVTVVRAGDYKQLPGKSSVAGNSACHVRPHATRGQTYPTPQGGEFTRQSFWLNRLYLRDQLARDI